MKLKVNTLKEQLRKTITEASKIPKKKIHRHLPNGVSPDDENYESYQSMIHDIAVTNPKLFRKMQNWD